MVFGPKSSGKSCVINSIKTAIERKYVHVSSKQEKGQQLKGKFPSFPVNNSKTVKFWLSMAYTGETIKQQIEQVREKIFQETFNSKDILQ